MVEIMVSENRPPKNAMTKYMLIRHTNPPSIPMFHDRLIWAQGWQREFEKKGIDSTIYETLLDMKTGRRWFVK